MLLSSRALTALCNALLLVAPAFLAAEPPVPAPVALIAPLSGPAADFGISALQGLQMALPVVTQDDQLQPARAVSGYQLLRATGRYPAIFTVGATSGNAVAPLAERDQQLLIAAASDPAVSNHRGFVIRVWPSGADEGGLIAQDILSSLPQDPAQQQAAIVFSPSDYYYALRDGVVAGLARGSVTPILREFATDEVNFSMLILQLQKKQVRSVVLFLSPGKAALFAKQSHVQGYRPQFYSGVQFESRAEVAAADGALTGARYVTVAVPGQFRAEYLRRYPHSGTAISIAYVFAQMGGVIAALQVSGSSCCQVNEVLRGAKGFTALRVRNHGEDLLPALALQQVGKQ